MQLMDRLCSLSSQKESGSNEKQSRKQKVAAMAWAAFQVLANRCIEWEKVEGTPWGGRSPHLSSSSGDRSTFVCVVLVFWRPWLE